MFGRRALGGSTLVVALVVLLVGATAAAANPGLRVSDPILAETDEKARFVVRLSRPAHRDIVVRYELRLHKVPGWGATPEADYMARSGPVRIPEGKRRRPISMPILDDNTDEHDEVFGFYVTKPGGTVLRDRQGVATIVDDDPVPSVSIGDTSVVEGDDGAVEARFPLSLSNPTEKFPGAWIYASPHTAMGTATVRADYCCDWMVVRPTELSGPLAPGYATWQVYGYTDDEPDETFVMRLSLGDNAPFEFEPNVTIGDGEAIGTIVDDDP